VKYFEIMKITFIQQFSIKSFLLRNLGIKQTIIKNTFWLGLAEGITRLLKLALIIYIARIFGAAAYGKFNFALAFTSIFLIFSDLGISQISLREISKDKNKIEDFYPLFSFKIILAALTFLLIIFSAIFITNDLITRNLIFLLGLYSLINSILMFFFVMFQAWQKMEYQAAFQIAEAFFLGISTVIVIFQFPQILNLGYAYVFAAIAGAVFLLFFLYIKKIPVKLEIRPKVWKRYVSISWPLMFTGLSDALLVNTDTIIMGYWDKIRDVGWYQAAYKVINFVFIPIGLIYTAFFPALGNIIKKSRERTMKIFDDFVKVMIFFAFPITIGGIILAPQIIDWLYGSEFYPSIFALQILLIMAGLNFMIAPLHQWLILTDRQKQLFFITMVSTVLNIILNIVLIPKFSLYGAGMSTVLASFVFFLLLYIITKNEISIFSNDKGKTILFALIASLALYYTITRPQIYNLHPTFSCFIGFIIYSSIFLAIKKFLKF